VCTQHIRVSLQVWLSVHVGVDDGCAYGQACGGCSAECAWWVSIDGHVSVCRFGRSGREATNKCTPSESAFKHFLSSLPASLQSPLFPICSCKCMQHTHSSPANRSRSQASCKNRHRTHHEVLNPNDKVTVTPTQAKTVA